VGSSLLESLDEFVDLPFVLVLRLELPKEEGADRVPAQDGVEQPDDLFRAPYELTLDGGQKVPHIQAIDDCSDAF
jgi:hypothetical protein